MVVTSVALNQHLREISRNEMTDVTDGTCMVIARSRHSQHVVFVEYHTLAKPRLAQTIPEPLIGVGVEHDCTKLKGLEVLVIE